MASLINRISERAFSIWYISLIFIIYGALSWQGFDMCDEGWVMTGYQQIFNDPSSVEYLFLYYSSQLLGGIWNLLFGTGGILSFRFLTVIVLTSSFVLVYRLLMTQISRLDFVIGFFIILFGQCVIMVFHHNYLTILLYCVVSVFLYYSLTEVCRWKIFLAGIFLGIEFFARIPNLSLLGLIIVLVPFSSEHTLKKGLLFLGIFIGGCLCGVLIILLLMKSLGHLEIFENSLISGFSAAESSNSTHNLSYMMSVYLSNYYAILKCMVFLFSVPILYICYLKKAGNPKLWVTVLAVFLCSFLTLLSLKREMLIFNIYAFCTFMLLFGLYKYHSNSDKMYLILISLVTLYCLPLGSDWGIGNMGSSCIFIAVPLSVGICTNMIAVLKQSGLRYMSIIALCFTALIGGKGILSQCYFDMGWRWHKLYKINSPLATTYTTLENKKALEGLLHELPKYLHKDDYAFIFQSTPTLHYLTQTRPYLGNPWPWTYDSDNLQRQIDLARYSHIELPVLVRDKGQVSSWQKHYKDWNRDDIEDTYLHKSGRVKALNRFIDENGYIVVWEDDLFQILLPTDNQDSSER